EKELAVLKGRVDGLEAKVGVLEAQQFSTTTKLQGDMTFVLGGVGYGGNAIPAGTNNLNGAAATPARNAVSFNYDMRLNFSTSWSGKDLLYTRLRAGNFGASAFNGAPVPMAALDKASQSAAGANVVFVDRLYYRFPVGKELTFTLGAIARNTEMISFRPQAYNADILDFFTLAGAPGAYNKATGQGFGVVWKQNVQKGKPYLTASVNYVAANGNDGNPTTGGIMSANGRNNVTVQLGGRGKNWGAAALYRYGSCGTNDRRGTTMAAANITCGPVNAGSNNSLGLGAYWQPLTTGWIPSVSLGWGYNGISQSNQNPGFSSINNVAASQSWAAMFQWDDAFAKGNAAGFAFGQGVMATATRVSTQPLDDSNYAFEAFYRFRVTDKISVTPAVFYLSNPLGQQQRNNNTVLNNTGFLIQTNFKF
ncbi:MAG: carbohydrate porin, partial [Cyanobacteria bacterium K_DeepCast_0m_m1_088]|nr:carbohydrate porin [Cyanobacteria bacterium K_DeepCast_0m_m1_088]